MSTDSLTRRIFTGLVTPPIGRPPAGRPPAIAGYSLPRRALAGLVGVSLRPADAQSDADVWPQAVPPRTISSERLPKPAPSAPERDPSAHRREKSGKTWLWLRLRGWIVANRQRHQAADDNLTEALLREQLHQRERLHQEALLEAGRRRLELLSRAIDDPSLAATVSLQSDVPPERQRQFLFIQATYESMLLEYATGALSWEGLIARLRVFARNEVVAEYWERTREERRALPHDSLEAQAARAVDLIVEELADDPDEWWVVGGDFEEARWRY